MIIVSLRHWTAERRGRQNACVWQTWPAYYSCLLSWSSLKLTSRLSHKVFRLLSSPVLLRKFTTIITGRNKKGKSAVEDIRKQTPHWNKGFLTKTIMRFLVCHCNPLADNLSKATQQHFCSVRFNMANDEQCGFHLMVFVKTANYSLPRSCFGLVPQPSSFGRSSCVTRQNRLRGRLCQVYMVTRTNGLSRI